MRNKIIDILNILDDEDLKLVYSFVERLSYDYEDAEIDDEDFVENYVSEFSHAPIQEFVDYNEFANTFKDEDDSSEVTENNTPLCVEGVEDFDPSDSLDEDELKKSLGDDYMEKIMMWRMD